MIPSSPSPLRLAAGVAANVLGLALAANAQDKSFLLSDFESGAGMNALSGYWYHFSDVNNEGNSKITTYDSVTGFWDATSVGEGFGGSTYSGALGFVFGDKRPTCGATCTFDPEVTLATDLRNGDTVANLTGATHVTFAAKANTPLKVSFLAVLHSIKDHAHWRQVVDVGTEWKEFSIALQASATFSQPTWGLRVPFDASQVTHFHWLVTKGLNSTLLSDTLLIDDVKVVGWTPPDPSSLRRAGRHAAGLGSGLRALGLSDGFTVSLAGAPAGRGGMVRVQDLSGRVLAQVPYGAGQEKMAVPLRNARAGLALVRILPSR